MSDPKMIKEIMDTVTIPVMAKARIGHFVECQVRSPIPNGETSHLRSPSLLFQAKQKLTTSNV
jgi:muramoyltetrapeptide carboxypeptidase LdcA involved in peptidoglycan recycling